MKTRYIKQIPSQIYNSVYTIRDAGTLFRTVKLFMSVAIDWYLESSQVLLDKLCLSHRTDIPVKAVFAICYCSPSFFSQRSKSSKSQVIKAKPLGTSRKHFRFWDLLTDYFITWAKLKQISPSILTSKCKPFVCYFLDIVLGKLTEKQTWKYILMYNNIDTKLCFWETIV